MPIRRIRCELLGRKLVSQAVKQITTKKEKKTKQKRREINPEEKLSLSSKTFVTERVYSA